MGQYDPGTCFSGACSMLRLTRKALFLFLGWINLCLIIEFTDYITRNRRYDKEPSCMTPFWNYK